MKRSNILLLVLLLVISGCTSTFEDQYKKTYENSTINKSVEDNKQNTEINNQPKYNYDIFIRDFNFIPSETRIKQGTDVTWTNEDESAHSIETDNGLLTSDELQKGDSVIFKFDKKGIFNYHCDIHPDMKGTVIVD